MFTDEEIVRKVGWLTRSRKGEDVVIHRIGEYAIAEYKNWGGATRFDGFVEDDAPNESYDSLDSCLIGLICYKHLGHVQGPHGASFIEKALGL